MLSLPFDPIKRAYDIESMVTQGLNRKYHRFRPAPYYKGIATADAVGCCFLCAYCWSYFRILEPQNYGEFYSPKEVANRLLKIAQNKGFNYVRITGCEPLLGERSLKHLLEVIYNILEKNNHLTFILETNGLLLGYYPEYIKQLIIPQTRRLSIRVALKGWDPVSFENITGADKEYFEYPLIGLKKMIEENLDAWPAVMLDVFGRVGLEKLKARMHGLDLDCQIETEQLERYPYVMDNIIKRKINLIQ